jgi:uncharacterized phage protein gp47/JayE
MAFGVTDTGFVIKTLDVITSEVQAEQSQNISDALDFQPTGLIGQLNGIMLAPIADAWMQLASLYNGMDPDQATGAQLTNLGAITGALRNPASPTTVLCTVNVNSGFNQAVGTMFASISGNPTALFANAVAVVSVGGGVLTGIEFKAVNNGPTQALAGTLTVIAAPISGWNSITNPTDGAPGTLIQGDPSFRQKRNASLSAAGTSTVDAIRADVLEKMQPPTTTTDTVSCTVLHNESDITDANNLPPHTIEVIAFQLGAITADDQALAALILISKTGATGTYGLTGQNATDSQGNVEFVRFTRPSPLTLYIAITVIVNAATFPADGITQVKNALLNYAQLEYGPGSEVFLRPLSGAVFPSPLDPNIGVVGVKNITVFTCDMNPVPVGTADIPVDVRQVASFDSSRIAVTVING